MVADCQRLETRTPKTTKPSQRDTSSEKNLHRQNRGPHNCSSGEMSSQAGRNQLSVMEPGPVQHISHLTVECHHPLGHERCPSHSENSARPMTSSCVGGLEWACSNYSRIDNQGTSMPSEVSRSHSPALMAYIQDRSRHEELNFRTTSSPLNANGSDLP